MLTNREILNQIRNGNISISNMMDNALDKPNSCLVSIEDVLYTYDYSVIDTKEKNYYLEELTQNSISRLRRVKIPETGFLLEPHKVYLAKLRENIKTKGYIPVLNGRTSLSLLGLSIELNSGYAEENFDGNFILSIVATMPTIIYPNVPIENMTFFKSLSYDDKTRGMLGGNEIKKQLADGKIVISPQDNIVINPNSVNLTLNKSVGSYTSPILDMKKDNPIEAINIPEEGLILYPDKVYIARTNEWTETYDYIPMMSGRSSLGRLGLHAHCSAGMGSIGYKGYWHLGLRSVIPIRIYENMKCCQIYYFTPEGEIVNNYEGSMQALEENIVGSQFYKKLTKKM